MKKLILLVLGIICVTKTKFKYQFEKNIQISNISTKKYI